MALTINLKSKLHRKIWEPIFTFLPTNAVAGAHMVVDQNRLNQEDCGFYVAGVSSIYWFSPKHEGFGQLPNSGSAGTFGAGACSYFHPAGPSGTASAGSATTLTTTFTIVRNLAGTRVRITAGTGAGQEAFIKNNTIGANSILTFDRTLGTAPDATSVYTIFSGRLWFYVPGATSGFNYYDWATNAWTSRSVVSGPAITANEGYLIGTPGLDSNWEKGTASAGAATTLTDASRSWEVDRWKFTIVQIVRGTGAGQFRYVTTNTSTQLTVNAAWTTTPDATSVYEIIGFAGGIASAGAATTLTNTSGANWATNMWANYQVRIVSGTGVGQVRTIASNTSGATGVLTVSSAWATNPDATSYFVIEGDDNSIYFLGGAAVTLFKYSISGNTWATLTPGAARAVAPGAGASGNWIGQVEDVRWYGQLGTNQTQNGRYIYSFRGTAGGVLDIYDIAGNTWISGWSYGGSSGEVFGAGSSYTDGVGDIYVQKDATGRLFEFDVGQNELVPKPVNTSVQGAAVSGKKLALVKYRDDSNGKTLKWIYMLANTSAQMHRMMEFS